MSENKPDLMAELAEVVVRVEKARSLESVMRANQDAADFLRTHHAELEAVVRDAAMWRMVTSEHSVCGDETAKCHVIVGVNMWRGDEWLSFHQCTPEELQKALKHDTAMRAGEGQG